MISEDKLIPYHTVDLRYSRVLVLSPHPDDETIGCGGALHLQAVSGSSIRVIFLTNGAKGDTSQKNKKEYVSIRKAEANKACAILGIDEIEFWDIEDRELSNSVSAIRRMADLLVSYGPEIVYAPSPMEIHPDHRAAAFLLESAIKVKSDIDFKVAFYEISQPIKVNALVDISSVLKKKTEALKCYGSQLKMRPYDDICLSLNRFRSMTLQECVTHAEGFFLCQAEDIRFLGAYNVIRHDEDILLSEDWNGGLNIRKEGLKINKYIEKEQRIHNLEKIDRNCATYIDSIISRKDHHVANFVYKVRKTEELVQTTIKDKERNIKNLSADAPANAEEIKKIKQESKEPEEAVISKFETIKQNIERKLEKEQERAKNLQLDINLLSKQIHDKDVHIANIEAELSFINSSRVWRSAEFLRNFFYNGLLKPFPMIRKGMLTLSREGARSTIAKARVYFRKNPFVPFLLGIESDYDRWIKRCETPKKDSASAMAKIKAFSYYPTISIIMPVYNVDPKWLEKAIESVRSQWYPHWELCIADDASPLEAIREVLRRFEGMDNRVRIVYLKTNHGISDASNKALELATGDFVGFLDHDDELSEDALYRCVKVLNKYSVTNLIYSDEDKLEINGKRVEPFFKPDFSPDLLLSMNYICHFSLIRRGVINDIGGFRRGFEGSQDYDLLLRVIERIYPATIHHIPWVLYHWRKIPGSAAAAVDAKSYAYNAAKQALREYLERNGEAGDVQDGLFVGAYRVSRRIDASETVSIIIPLRDRLDLLKICVGSILKKTSYPKYEIILVDNQSKDDLTRQYLEQLSKVENIKILRYDYPFNYSAINNFAVKTAAGRFLLLLNNDMEVIVDEWLSAMVEHIQREEVGVVGAKLIFPNNLIQHAGVVIGVGESCHAFSHLPETDNGYFGLASVIRNCSAVTGACLMTRRDVYESIGGLDETNLTIAYNDVDYCLKAIEAGYRVVYTPYARLYHHESASRGDDNDGMLKIRYPWKYERVLDEREYMRERWKKYIENDPYYNPNLTRHRNDFSIGAEPI